MKWSYRGVASGGHGGGLKHAGIQNRSGCGSGGQFSSSGGANFDGQSEYASRKKSKKHEHVVETVSNDRNVHHSNRCYSGGAENTGNSVLIVNTLCIKHTPLHNIMLSCMCISSVGSHVQETLEIWQSNWEGMGLRYILQIFHHTCMCM